MRWTEAFEWETGGKPKCKRMGKSVDETDCRRNQKLSGQIVLRQGLRSSTNWFFLCRATDGILPFGRIGKKSRHDKLVDFTRRQHLGRRVLYRRRHQRNEYRAAWRAFIAPPIPPPALPFLTGLPTHHFAGR